MIKDFLIQFGILCVVIIPGFLVAFTLWCRHAIVRPDRQAADALRQDPRFAHVADMFWRVTSNGDRGRVRAHASLAGRPAQEAKPLAGRAAVRDATRASSRWPAPQIEPVQGVAIPKRKAIEP